MFLGFYKQKLINHQDRYIACNKSSNIARMEQTISRFPLRIESKACLQSFNEGNTSPFVLITEYF